jgi:hypothetical protein
MCSKNNINMLEYYGFAALLDKGILHYQRKVDLSVPAYNRQAFKETGKTRRSN